MGVAVTVIIPTYNEQQNLPGALESVKGWAGQVIVVDSYSTDKTVEIARGFGAEVFQNPYKNMAAQRMWGLNLPAVKNKWIFNLDADEQMTDGLKTEIENVLSGVGDDVGGFAARRKHIFMGRWMKHGGDYIWLIRLVRKDRCRIIKTLYANEHTIIEGSVKKLQNDFLHLPQKSFSQWMERQNRGSLKYALAIIKNDTDSAEPDLKRGEKIEGSIRTWLNYNVFYRMPFCLRPFIRFFVNYFLRGGFLDGWQGYVYHTVNDFIYPFFVYVNRREIRQSDLVRHLAEQSKWR